MMLWLSMVILLMGASANGFGQLAGEPGWFAAIPGLTEDQEAKINKLRVEHLKEMQNYRNQLAENKARYRTLMTAAQPDMKAINANIEERGKITTEMQKKQAAHLQAIRQVLTEEQRVYFDEHFSSRGMWYFGRPGRCCGMGPYGAPGSGMGLRRGHGWNN